MELSIRNKFDFITAVVPRACEIKSCFCREGLQALSCFLWQTSCVCRDKVELFIYSFKKAMLCIRQMKNHYVDVLPANRYLFIYLLFYLFNSYLLKKLKLFSHQLNS